MHTFIYFTFYCMTDCDPYVFTSTLIRSCIDYAVVGDCNHPLSSRSAKQRSVPMNGAASHFKKKSSHSQHYIIPKKANIIQFKTSLCCCIGLGTSNSNASLHTLFNVGFPSCRYLRKVVPCLSSKQEILVPGSFSLK